MSLEAHFKIKKHGSTLYREIIGGVTTFIALSYIIFVQPAVLAAAGAEVSVPASLLHPAAWAP